MAFNPRLNNLHPLFNSNAKMLCAKLHIAERCQTKHQSLYLQYGKYWIGVASASGDCDFELSVAAIAPIAMKRLITMAMERGWR